MGFALISGLSTGFDLYYRLLYVLGIVTLVAFLWTLVSLNRLSVTADRQTRRAAVGDHVERKINVENLTFFPRPALVIEDLTDLTGGEGGKAVSMTWRGSRSLTTVTRARERGVYRMGPVRVSSTDVFGLFRRERLYGESDSLVVLPRTFDAPELSIPATNVSRDRSSRRLGHDLTPHAATVREYEFGDSVSRVHWNSTARLGKLMSKEFDLGSARDIWLLVDFDRHVQAGEMEDGTDEYVASIAASLAKAYLEARMPVGLVAYGSRRVVLPADTGAGQLERVLESLVMTRADGSVPLEEALPREEELWGHQSSLVVITPSGDDTWVSGLRELARRRIGVAVVLLEGSSFGGPDDTSHVLPELGHAGVPTYLVRQGDDLPLALSHPVTGPSLGVARQRHEAEHMPNGRSADSEAPGEEPEPDAVRRLRDRWARWNPSQGWTAFALIMATLLVVGESITSADWVPTPGLMAVMVYAVVAGLLLAKARASALVLHPISASIGLAAVSWHASSLIEQGSRIERVRELWSRLGDGYQTATSGGFSTDLVPVTFALLALAWVLGYASSWFIFRSSNFWVAVVLAGAALISNLSFLPDPPASRFFLFMLFAFLLVARLTSVRRDEAWRRAGVESSSISGWLSAPTALVLTAVVLAIAAFLPLRVLVSYEMAGVWAAGRAPIASFEDGFARMFAGIPARKDVSGRLFGSTLPFLGQVSLGRDIVFWTSAESPYYWLSRTYSEYTSQGWRAGDASTIEVGPNSRPLPSTDTLKRVPIRQGVQLNVDTSDLLTGGGVEWTSRDAVLETLEPREYLLQLRDSSSEAALPEHLRRLTHELRDKLSPPPDGILQAYINTLLPDDLEFKSVRLDPGADGRTAVTAVKVARRAPFTPEITSWTFAEDVRAGEAYQMVSMVSVASAVDLREAGADYPGFLADHYLQLPPGLPQRVRGLAEKITAGAKTPLDRALMVQAFLRGPDFTYSLNIEPPPRGADGVDNFLFETRTGYSAYFASAMAVMLRSVGVPTRMAAGYAPGEEITDDGRRIVKDTDSHGWVQVYFPRYGWIDMEPTPSKQIIPQGPLASTISNVGTGGIEITEPLEDFLECDPTLLTELGECVELPSAGEAPAAGGAAADSPTSRPKRTALVVAVYVAALSLAAAWLALRFLGDGGLSRASAVEAAYTRLNRMGRLAGLRRRLYQTPSEYADELGDLVPAIAGDAVGIASAFAGERYGGREPSDLERAKLDDAWRRARRVLMIRTLGRLIPESVRSRL